jgi:molybdopterin/thiamine biosynthesis adenylyltransferase
MLCLDHPVLGVSERMSGAEAVERAERLWKLWETDRAQLAEEEADAPDPWGNYVSYTPGTAIAMVDADVSGADRGFVHVGLTSLVPLRGALTALRVTHPGARSVDIPESANAVLRGPYELIAPWRRIDVHPPGFDEATIIKWLESEHRGMVDKALQFTAGSRAERPDLPTMVGFVYPDEGPKRGETHDAWMFVLIRPDRRVELPQPFHLRTDERWLRQPQLQALSDKRVAVVGVGALGSQVADLLARAGVSDFVVVDNDVVSPGNRVRHALDLGDLGHSKVLGIAERIRRVNPWATVETFEARLGTVAVGAKQLGELKKRDDEIAERVGDCDLIVNATAHSVASSYVSAIAAERNTPAVHTYVSAGAWGARITIQRPGISGCWDCLAWWQATAAADRPDGFEIGDVSEEHSREVVLERGCADPTFAGPGFELTATAAATTRAVVGLLSDGGSYPQPDFDLATLRYRGGDSQRTHEEYSSMPQHPKCTTCRP